MTRKAVLIAISRNVVWKETARYLKHYRKVFYGDLKKYNKKASQLIALYRKTESKIKNENVRYTKFEYREMIKKLEKGK